MLSPSYNRAYQDFLTLLTEFKSLLINEAQIEPMTIQQKFKELQEWFGQNIVDLDREVLDTAIAPRWQSVQTEIKREFKLLSTDILFFSSARQNATQAKRLQSIGDRISKLIGYCQIMLK